uniref:Uncharacterized protein n=1 Tax=Sphaerodactylus townsendi TaxID=933632 RepID=A0ACB8EL95_9SAUR
MLSLLVLALVGAVFLGLNLVFLAIYLICLCCCKREEESETKKLNSCCITWTAVVAGLICWNRQPLSVKKAHVVAPPVGGEGYQDVSSRLI